MRNMQMQERDATMAYVIEKAHTYDPDPSHSEHVTALALALFEELRILHSYGSSERRLLEIAGRLHDIGWSRAVTGKHHKHTLDMIQELDIPGLTKQEQLICALIARYHTKALPDMLKHGQFASLDPNRRELVEWLAGLLRVADGLDCSHTSRVKTISCEVDARTIKISLEVAGNCQMEIEKARQKEGLLLSKTGREITYHC